MSGRDAEHSCKFMPVNNSPLCLSKVIVCSPSVKRKTRPSARKHYNQLEALRHGISCFFQVALIRCFALVEAPVVAK